MECGYNHNEFWNCTLREYALISEVNQQRLINEHNGRAWLAYHIVALQSSRKPIRFDQLLIKPSRRQPQSVPEMKEVARMIYNTFREYP